MPFLRDGKLRALAVGSSGRVDKLPEVPMIAEVLKKPGLDTYVWLGFLPPKRTPSDAVTRLQRENGTATKFPAIATLFAQTDTEFAPADSQRFAVDIRDGEARAGSSEFTIRRWQMALR